jgi:hypothetical protein
MDVNNKIVVVTGASRGIGAELARQFASAGAKVVVSARSEDALASLAEEINGVAIPFDATNSEEVRGYIEKVENEVGSIDVFINNAGIEISNLVEDLSEREIEETIQVNLITPQILSSLLVPRMLSRGAGHLVYTSSIAATSGNPGMSVYCASKGGLTRFAESLRMELRYTPLNVTILHLGPVDTGMWDAVDANPILKRGVDRFTKLGVLSVADPMKVAKRTLKAVQKNRREVRLPIRTAPNAILNGIGTRLFEALLTGIRHREEAGKAPVA